ncbi:FAD-dependent oxidoreductase [Thermodesulforhabdus norvegica]|uniref:Alkyl hydroperoxide reductase subunit F n=1 Tax=Thermodesulforhabdus norvegica TaxID=39841 RepID=A0A1I4UCM3_9BACT|nr:FAD-dependent oxidoreductase [Thermodesulforhabdus norvegica]SFM86729.1 alkyl hydroperoxide reductase subunit F [Thermodesulforhabdus norvegica]
MSRIRVYTVPGCPFCERLKKFLKEKGIDFEEREAPPYSEVWEEMVQKTGSGAVPQVLVDDKPLGGYLDVVFLEASGKLYQLMKPDEKTEGAEELFDVIILGAGPAGLSAAIYTARKLMKTLVISKNIGGQITWTFDIENYPGFSQVNAAELIEKFRSHVERYGVTLEVGKEVISADLTGRVKRVVLEDGRSFYGKTLIIATGSRHKVLNVPGEKELVGRGLSYCSTCDAPLFADSRVAVVGGGNSALEAVLDLAPIAEKLYLISLTPLTADPLLQEKVKALKKPVDMYLKYKTVRIIGDSEVRGIEIMSLDDGSTKVLDVDGVFVEIGLMPNSALFVDVLATNERGEIIIDEQCRTGVAGVFACGDVTHVPFKQIVVAAGEGAKAALAAYHYLMNRR